MPQVQSAKITRQIGNILIISSLILAGFTYFPIIKLYLQPIPNLPSNSNLTYFLTIPKIGAQAPIITDVNPWEPSEYLPALQKGIAQAQANPAFFFAHSSDLPWRMTRYNTAFLRLGELQKGDEIIITKDGIKYQFQVVDKIEVWPNQVQYLKENGSNQLILMTCTPLGTSFKRLLIFAKPL
ncbi:sortase [Candidatus Daviesbacteria bacterium]|nr:sortase [Candidatus Daviesbacteria bacterium]